MPSDGTVDLGARFLQAVSYLVEWVKHIVTISSGVMVLAVALLKDLVKGATWPMNYVIAVALVTSYVLMLLAIWKGLAFIRISASVVLTASEAIASGSDLEKLRRVLKLAQRLFFAGLISFAFLAMLSLWTWASGRVTPVQVPVQQQKTTVDA